MTGSDAPATKDEEQEGDDGQDDEDGVEHGPCSTPARQQVNVNQTESQHFRLTPPVGHGRNQLG